MSGSKICSTFTRWDSTQLSDCEMRRLRFKAVKWGVQDHLASEALAQAPNSCQESKLLMCVCVCVCVPWQPHSAIANCSTSRKVRGKGFRKEEGKAFTPSHLLVQVLPSICHNDPHNPTSSELPGPFLSSQVAALEYMYLSLPLIQKLPEWRNWNWKSGCSCCLSPTIPSKQRQELNLYGGFIQMAGDLTNHPAFPF